jgi:hypothetical protein
MIVVAPRQWLPAVPIAVLSQLLLLVAGLWSSAVLAQETVNPTATLQTAAGPPGTVVAASGTGWAPGSVTVLWDGSRPIGRVSVPPDGNWRVHFVLPMDAPVGDHSVSFEQQAPGAVITIVRVFTVTAP